MRKPPERPTIFLDRCLGTDDVAKALRACGVTVEVHDDHFKQDALDYHWLPVIARRGWVALTKDRRIKSRALERKTVIRERVAYFVLRGQNLKGAQMADAFCKALPRIERILRQYEPPIIATVTPSGHVKVDYGQRRGGIRRDHD